MSKSIEENNWEKGTIFSIAVWGYRGYWIVLKNTDEKYALCGRLKGDDPRMFPDGNTYKMLKSLYQYGGRIENNFLLRLLAFIKSF